MANNMKASKNNANGLDTLLEECCGALNLQKGNEESTLGSFKNRIKAIQEAAINNGEDIIRWLKDAMKAKKNGDDPYDYAMNKFDLFSSGMTGWRNNTKVNYRSAYKKFVLFVLGQYDADLYLRLGSKITELEFCKLVAKYALFCKVDVANLVKEGKLGSKENLNKGNPYFSWFYCMYQRKSGNSQKVGSVVKKITFDGNDVKYDCNNMAIQAIRKAVSVGLTCPLGNNYTLFDGYMACHIWDNSCHDNHFHTSVFNLVLLPKAIGGLSDYSNSVKELLQYEAAWRFCVYPRNYNSTNFTKAPKYYEAVKSLWRQPDEHNKAVENKKNNNQLSYLE
jgi:hypothetical protein